MLQIVRLRGRIARQQAQQMTDRLIGGGHVQAHVLFDPVEQFFAARQDDLGGLAVMEQPQHDPCEQQQAGEHDANVHVQRKPALFRAQWAGHFWLSMMVNSLLSTQHS